MGASATHFSNHDATGPPPRSPGESAPFLRRAEMRACQAGRLCVRGTAFCAREAGQKACYDEIVPGDSDPLVRARFCQEWLSLVAREEEPYKGRFFARVTEEMRQTIDGASRVAWLPLAVHVRLADIQLEAFGTARAHDYYRRAFSSSVKGPILGPLVLTGARLLGLSPASFVRWASRGYEAAYRNAGELAGEVLEARRARLVFSKLPAVCVASDAWLMSAQGSAYGVYDVLQLEGIVRLDTRERAGGKMVLELEWDDRKRAPPQS